uniref:Uncharacterized protein n=1 Tax=Nelumbo nucifera TaxID=4432 RepID=A0A822YJK7_NELNU|nr:TPA_asm: hypothetical protein HUJ06_011548 [Nelumbo nucifera]
MSPSTSTSSILSSSSRRCPPPLVSRPTTSTTASTPFKGVQSLINPPRHLPDSTRTSNVAEVSIASKMLFTSTWNLSVSFHGESFSLPINKMKAAPMPNLSNTRKATPEQRRTTPLRGKINGPGGIDQMENSKPIDQQYWPEVQITLLTRKKLIGSGTVGRALQQSMIDEGMRASFDGRLHQDSSIADFVKTIQHAMDANSTSLPLRFVTIRFFQNYIGVFPSDLTASDTESGSYGRTSGVQECNGVSQARIELHGISVPARFWQETNSRSRMTAPPKLISSKKPLSLSNSPISSPRTISITGSRTLSDIGGLHHLSGKVGGGSALPFCHCAW